MDTDLIHQFMEKQKRDEVDKTATVQDNGTVTPGVVGKQTKEMAKVIVKQQARTAKAYEKYQEIVSKLNQLPQSVRDYIDSAAVVKANTKVAIEDKRDEYNREAEKLIKKLENGKPVTPRQELQEAEQQAYQSTKKQKAIKTARARGRARANQPTIREEATGILKQIVKSNMSLDKTKGDLGTKTKTLPTGRTPYPVGNKDISLKSNKEVSLKSNKATGLGSNKKVNASDLGVKKQVTLTGNKGSSFSKKPIGSVR